MHGMDNFKIGDYKLGFPRKINSSSIFRRLEDGTTTLSRKSVNRLSSGEVSYPRRTEASVTLLPRPKKDYETFKKHPV
jgi:hypothetical protein